MTSLSPFLPSSLPPPSWPQLTYSLPPSLTHSLYSTLAFSARGHVIITATAAAVFERGRRRGEERSQSTFCCTHYFFRPSLPPTHLPNRIMQRRKDGQRCWQHVRPPYQRKGRKEGRKAIFRAGTEGAEKTPSSAAAAEYESLYESPPTHNKCSQERRSGRRRDGRIDGATSFLPSFLSSLFRVMKVHLRVGGRQEGRPYPII